ncbi:hypothetical protein [Dyadobacter psychrotolerans]|uniref:SDR family NAD(P)-dependent oxidoreductase n=1 Tax=Dyadobacter psychrotolerans TaxID=2541721 RepID=A0A4R5D827_9BACT|nr:hypothetical protein [Dyadobacter psychrotolerans]TDE07881.1 hypothetical protein E0F88_33420 [Dyadobacter psychrotolerans]
MLTARSLEKEFGARKNIDVIAFNPGLTGDTSLMAKQPAILKLLIPAIRPLFYLISLFKPAFFMGTAKRSAKALAELALGKVVLPSGRIYTSPVRGKLTSQTAQN